MYIFSKTIQNLMKKIQLVKCFIIFVFLTICRKIDYFESNLSINNYSKQNHIMS